MSVAVGINVLVQVKVPKWRTETRLYSCFPLTFCHRAFTSLLHASLTVCLGAFPVPSHQALTLRLSAICILAVLNFLFQILSVMSRSH